MSHPEQPNLNTQRRAWYWDSGTSAYRDLSPEEKCDWEVPDFDPMAPLPDLNIRRTRSWEPAARHYRDLTEAEKQAMQDTHE